ncbi:hypothetical protein [Geopseudomonas aromaticivorans]
MRLLFLLLALVFGWLIWEGVSQGRLRVNGWWGRVRWCYRSREPVMFWMSMGSYGLCFLIGLLFGVFAKVA